jgi:hypothetical protein
VVSRHDVNSLHLYPSEVLQTLCILHFPVDSDPDSSNLDCSTKVNNIILRKLSDQRKSCFAHID